MKHIFYYTKLLIVLLCIYNCAGTFASTIYPLDFNYEELKGNIFGSISESKYEFDLYNGQNIKTPFDYTTEVRTKNSIRSMLETLLEDLMVNEKKDVLDEDNINHNSNNSIDIPVSDAINNSNFDWEPVIILKGCEKDDNHDEQQDNDRNFSSKSYEVYKENEEAEPLKNKKFPDDTDDKYNEIEQNINKIVNDMDGNN